MSKEELERILKQGCAKELATLQKAQESLKKDPALAKFIDIEALHKALNIKIVRICIELVRTGKANAEEIGFMLSLREIPNGYLADMETYKHFLNDYDILVRDN